MQVSPKIIVIKNLNSKIHKLLSAPNVSHSTDVPSFEGVCHGMSDYGVGVFWQSSGSALMTEHKQERKLGRRAM